MPQLIIRYGLREWKMDPGHLVGCFQSAVIHLVIFSKAMLLSVAKGPWRYEWMTTRGFTFKIFDKSNAPSYQLSDDTVIFSKAFCPHLCPHYSLSGKKLHLRKQSPAPNTDSHTEKILLLFCVLAYEHRPREGSWLA